MRQKYDSQWIEYCDVTIHNNSDRTLKFYSKSAFAWVNGNPADSDTYWETPPPAEIEPGATVHFRQQSVDLTAGGSVGFKMYGEIIYTVSPYGWDDDTNVKMSWYVPKDGSPINGLTGGSLLNTEGTTWPDPDRYTNVHKSISLELASNVPPPPPQELRLDIDSDGVVAGKQENDDDSQLFKMPGYTTEGGTTGIIDKQSGLALSSVSYNNTVTGLPLADFGNDQLWSFVQGDTGVFSITSVAAGTALFMDNSGAVSLSQISNPPRVGQRFSVSQSSDGSYSIIRLTS